MNTWRLRLPDGSIKSGQNSFLAEGLSIPGFLIGSFLNEKGTLLSIPGDYMDKGENLSDLPLMFDLPDDSTPRSKHEDNVARVADYHSKHGGKTVISRVTITSPVDNHDNVFDSLCALYPDATVFHFSTSPTGTWIGASPELLMEAHSGKLFTMSLAGTRPIGTNEVWSHKNINEQRLVTDFIIDVFNRHKLNPTASPVETLRAGNIEHLCTYIEASLPTDWSEEALLSLLYDLSPTPALAGVPRKDSLRLISRLESHQRGFYGGFFGYMESVDKFRLNVNLRSALLTEDATYIYVGGGITADSIPEEEWEETSRKANTVALALS